MVTYAATVWFRAAQKYVGRRGLLSLQRIFTTRLSQSYCTLSTDGAAVLANLVPLDFRVLEEALRYFALRAKEPLPAQLRSDYADPLDSLSSYDSPVVPVALGHPVSRLSVPYSAGMPESLSRDSLFIYTDGSRIPGEGTRAAFAVYCGDLPLPNCEFRYRLATYCSIFQTEAFPFYSALEWATQSIVDDNPIDVHLLTDSLSLCLLLADANNSYNQDLLVFFCQSWSSLDSALGSLPHRYYRQRESRSARSFSGGRSSSCRFI